MTQTQQQGDDVSAFNSLAEEEAERRLASCLDVRRWVTDVVGGRPFPSRRALLAQASDAATELTDAEIDQALAGHPRIGERPSAGHDAEHSTREQGGVSSDGAVVDRLAAGNRAYEERFDRVFLIRAAGRSGEEILDELERRLGNDPDIERGEVVDNLREIALLRLREVL